VHSSIGIWAIEMIGFDPLTHPTKVLIKPKLTPAFNLALYSADGILCRRPTLIFKTLTHHTTTFLFQMVLARLIFIVVCFR
jgi:hypothetical protein